MMADQMREHFGVGGGVELVSGLEQAFLEPVEILNHTVMDDRDPAASVQVRVRVFVRRGAVGGPARVADAQLAGGGRSEEHTSELQSRLHLVCRLLLEKKKRMHVQ